jgi:hypothetical protein
MWDVIPVICMQARFVIRKVRTSPLWYFLLVEGIFFQVRGLLCIVELGSFTSSNLAAGRVNARHDLLELPDRR